MTPRTYTEIPGTDGSCETKVDRETTNPGSHGHRASGPGQQDIHRPHSLEARRLLVYNLL